MKQPALFIRQPALPHPDCSSIRSKVRSLEVSVVWSSVGESLILSKYGMCSSLREKIDTLAGRGHSEEWSSNSNTSANSKPCVKDDLGFEFETASNMRQIFDCRWEQVESKFPSPPDDLTSHTHLQICPVFRRNMKKQKQKISSRCPFKLAGRYRSVLEFRDLLPHFCSAGQVQIPLCYVWELSCHRFRRTNRHEILAKLNERGEVVAT
jgi:hypothetical protein